MFGIISIKEAFQWVLDNIIQKFIAWLLLVFAWFKDFGDMVLESVFDALANFVPVPVLTPVQDALAMANYIFPVSEALTMGMALFTWWLMVLAYRVIKSWFPTVSGT